MMYVRYQDGLNSTAQRYGQATMLLDDAKDQKIITSHHSLITFNQKQQQFHIQPIFASCLESL